MKKTSIAFIIGSLNSGGAERVVSTLSNELIKKYKITIITFIGIPPFYELDDRIKIIHCYPETRPSKNLFQGLKNNYQLFKKISRFLREEKIELTIGFLTSSNIMAVLSSRANKIPVIISERINPSSSKKPFIWEKLRRYTYPKADYLIIQTEVIKHFFTSWVDKSKLVILPNPLSPDLHRDDKNQISRRNRVLNIGRLTDQKGQDILIRAFANLNPKGWELIIVGEGPKRTEYEKLIAKLGMSERIFLVGRKTNISEYYNSAKIFAFTSRFEGFPNALIEAMYMGVPCISTDCPTGPSELIDNGKNGFLIKMNDQEILKKKLEILMNDTDLREKFSKLGMITVEPFGIEKVTEQWNDVITLAVNSRI